MPVDAREPEVFHGLLAQDLKELRVRGLRGKISGADLVEERAQLLPVHLADQSREVVEDS